jgi:hypothetical protein
VVLTTNRHLAPSLSVGTSIFVIIFSASSGTRTRRTLPLLLQKTGRCIVLITLMFTLQDRNGNDSEPNGGNHSTNLIGLWL